MTDDAFEAAAVSWLTSKGYTVAKGAPEDNSFEAFWALYPSSKGKEAAQRAFAKQPDPAAVIAQLRAHLLEGLFTQRDRKYYPHASTWLNSGQWKDAAGVDTFKKPQIGGATKSRKALDDWLDNG